MLDSNLLLGQLRALSQSRPLDRAAWGIDVAPQLCQLTAVIQHATDPLRKPARHIIPRPALADSRNAPSVVPPAMELTAYSILA